MFGNLDITFCSNSDECPSKETCARHTRKKEIPEERPVSMSMFADTIVKGKDKCDCYFTEEYVPHNIVEDFRKLLKNGEFDKMDKVVQQVREFRMKQ